MLRSNWRDLKHGIHSEHVFAIGDVHGHATPLQEALETIARIPTDDMVRHLIFLGDTIDRGPENFETMHLVEHAAQIANVDKVTRLTGNHEIMLYKAINEPQEHMMFWATYGGIEIVKDFDPDEEITNEIALADRLKEVLPRYLTKDPSTRENYAVVDDVLFVHAGLSPHMDSRTFLTLGYDDPMPGQLHWAWIRNSFLDWKGGWKYMGNPMTVAHGHTATTQMLFEDTVEIENAVMLEGSHSRINLDVGAGYQVSQIAMAEFNAGSYRVHVFQDDAYKPRPDPSL